MNLSSIFQYSEFLINSKTFTPETSKLPCCNLCWAVETAWHLAQVPVPSPQAEDTGQSCHFSELQLLIFPMRTYLARLLGEITEIDVGETAL